MQPTIAYTVNLIFCFSTCVLGRWIVKNPETTSKFFTFGQISTKFTVAYCRIVGRFFLVMGALGAIVSIILIPLALFGFNFGD